MINQSRQLTRPRSVTLMLVMVFLLGGWQIWQAVLYWRQFALLKQYGLTIDLRVLGVGAMVWGVVWMITAVSQLILPASLLCWLPHALLSFCLYLITIQLVYGQTSYTTIQWWILIILTIALPIGARRLLKQQCNP